MSCCNYSSSVEYPTSLQIDENKNKFKIIILGNSYVGKTTMVHTYLNKKGGNLPTQGASFFVKNETINGVNISLEIWDTAGQERYFSLLPIYIRGADVSIITYAIDDLDSYQKLDFWIKAVHDTSPKSIIYVVGTKLDLESTRLIDRATAELFAQGKYYYTEISSFKNIGVVELFDKMLNEIRDHFKQQNNHEFIDL